MAKFRVMSTLLVSLILVSGVSIPIAFASNSAGSVCTKAGQIVSINGQQLICSLIWTVQSGSKKAPGSTPKSSTSGKVGISQSHGLALLTIAFANDGLGDAGATARVENITNQTLTGVLEITIFAKDGATPALTLEGSADSVASGDTVTVDFISSGSGALPSGSFKYAFQATTF